MSGTMSESRKPTALLMAAFALTLWGCPSSKPDDQPTEKPADGWRSQSVALSVEGFQLAGGERQMTKWSGSGVFVAPGVIATNAHVASRATKVTATDDNGRPHIFTKILAIDMKNDLALLQADYVAKDVEPARRLERPADPKDLRRTEILVVGNTGGLGLSTYEGRVVNVVTSDDSEILMHDGQTAGGSSGGPVFNRQTWELLGINRGRLDALRFSVAIPVWYVSQWLSSHGSKPAKEMATAFNITGETKLMNQVQRKLCLNPGQAIDVPMSYSNGTDFAVIIAPADAQQPILYGLAIKSDAGQGMIESGNINQMTLRAFTTPVTGQYIVKLGVPANAGAQGCFAFAVGQLDWSAQIN